MGISMDGSCHGSRITADLLITDCVQFIFRFRIVGLQFERNHYVVYQLACHEPQ